MDSHRWQISSCLIRTTLWISACDYRTVIVANEKLANLPVCVCFNLFAFYAKGAPTNCQYWVLSIGYYPLDIVQWAPVNCERCLCAGSPTASGWAASLEQATNSPLSYLQTKLGSCAIQSLNFKQKPCSLTSTSLLQYSPLLTPEAPEPWRAHRLIW